MFLYKAPPKCPSNECALGIRIGPAKRGIDPLWTPWIFRVWRPAPENSESVASWWGRLGPVTPVRVVPAGMDSDLPATGWSDSAAWAAGRGLSTWAETEKNMGDAWQACRTTESNPIRCLELR